MNYNCQDSCFQTNNQNCQQSNNQCCQQNRCGCQQSCCGCQQNSCGFQQSSCGCPFSRPRPIFAPKRVCTSFQNQFVEQPVICPIECRRVNNIVYVPRYYPQYEQTCFSQNNTMAL